MLNRIETVQRRGICQIGAMPNPGVAQGARRVLVDAQIHERGTYGRPSLCWSVVLRQPARLQTMQARTWFQPDLAFRRFFAGALRHVSGLRTETGVVTPFTLAQAAWAFSSVRPVPITWAPRNARTRIVS